MIPRVGSVVESSTNGAIYLLLEPADASYWEPCWVCLVLRAADDSFEGKISVMRAAWMLDQKELGK